MIDDDLIPSALIPEGMTLDQVTPDGMTVREKIKRGMRPDWDYTHVDRRVRQIHQGLYDGRTFEELGVSEPFPEDHLEVASLLADLPEYLRVYTLKELEPEFNADLLAGLVRCELIHRFLTRVRGKV